jgi:hypothetical protein
LSLFIKKSVIAILLFILALFVGIACISVLTIESKPLVEHKQALNTETAKHAKALSARVIESLRVKNKPVDLVIKRQELEGMLTIARRAFPNLQGQFKLTENSLAVALSLPISQSVLGQYVNVSFRVLPSNNGLDLDYVQIGRLSLSGKIFLNLSEFFLDYFLQQDLVTTLLDSVKSVALTHQQVLISYQLPKGLDFRGNDQSQLAKLRDKLSLFGDPELIAHYYQKLLDYKPERHQVSLAEYVSLVFSEARQRTLSQSVEIRAENQAAILALATYFGSYRFEYLIGNVKKSKQLKQSNFSRRATLAGRIDLQQHFIYSAAIQIFANQGVGDVIGELKELIDSSDGGSGFSFADLMADRAGVRFANIATGSDQSALALQKLMAQEPLLEDQLFPSIIDLPEGISEADFKAYYQNAESANYLNLVASIDQRLEKIAVYQLL